MVARGDARCADCGPSLAGWARAAACSPGSLVGASRGFLPVCSWVRWRHRAGWASALAGGERRPRLVQPGLPARALRRDRHSRRLGHRALRPASDDPGSVVGGAGRAHRARHRSPVLGCSARAATAGCRVCVSPACVAAAALAGAALRRQASAAGVARALR